MASDGRKSLMIGKEAHAHLMQLADTFNVSQPDLVEALIKSADKMRLQATLTEMANQRTLTVAEQNKKRQLLEKALKDMSAGEIEALLKQVAA